MNKIFRVLIVISTSAYVFFVLLMPYISFITTSQEETDAISRSSYGAMFDFPEWFWLFSLFIWVATSIGMYFFIPLARKLYFLLVIIYLLMSPFSGVNAYTALEMFSVQLINILDGAIIIMAFFTSVNLSFEARSNKPSNLTGANDAPSS